MIANLMLFQRVMVKLGDDEKHVFDRGRLMYTEVVEIERVTGLQFPEWEYQFTRCSIAAIGALLHILRKRDGQASDFGSMQFNVLDLDAVPIHDDGSEFTDQEIQDELARRVAKAEAGEEPDPTPGGDAATSPEPEPEENRPDTTSTSLSSLNGSTSGPGSGSTSPGMTSSSSKPTLTGT